MVEFSRGTEFARTSKTEFVAVPQSSCCPNRRKLTRVHARLALIAETNKRCIRYVAFALGPSRIARQTAARHTTGSAISVTLKGQFRGAQTAKTPFWFPVCATMLYGSRDHLQFMRAEHLTSGVVGMDSIENNLNNKRFRKCAKKKDQAASVSTERWRLARDALIGASNSRRIIVSFVPSRAGANRALFSWTLMAVLVPNPRQ